jgi:hypothetical protein
MQEKGGHLMTDRERFARIMRDMEQRGEWRLQPKTYPFAVERFSGMFSIDDRDDFMRRYPSLKGIHVIDPEPGVSHMTGPDWLELIGNFFVTVATLATVIQGLDVIERRWREYKEKHQHHAPLLLPGTDEIIEIILVMDDGSLHSFQCWMSNPDALRAYIDAFNDPTSKIKPFQVLFKKRRDLPLVVDVTTDGKDNRQLNALLDYLDIEQP